MIRKALRNNAKLAEILYRVPDEYLDPLIAVIWKRSTKANEVVAMQGDVNAEELYIVCQGDFRVECNEQEHCKLNHYGNHLDSRHHATQMNRDLRQGDMFGELALTHQAPRPATLQCMSSNGCLWVVERAAWKVCLINALRHRPGKMKGIIDQTSVFSTLTEDEKIVLAESLTEVHYIKGEYLFHQGEMGECFYIVDSGEVGFFTEDKNGKESLISTIEGENFSRAETRPKLSLETGAEIKLGGPEGLKIPLALQLEREKPCTCFFGERSLLKSEPRGASAKVTSDFATLMILTKERVEHFIGSLAIALKMTKEQRERMDIYQDTVKAIEKAALQKWGKKSGFYLDAEMQKQDLKTLALLGCGHFGTVTLEQDRETGQTFAMKRLSKGYS